MTTPVVTQIGPHAVRHGDALDGLDDLMDGETAALCYVDPPWGQGLLTGFESINARDTGASKPGHQYRDFMERLFRLIKRHTRGWVLMEYGVRWEDDIRGWAHELGFTHSGVGHTVYGPKKRPSHVHVMHTGSRGALHPRIADFDGTSGLDTIRVAQAFTRPGEVLLDPCCGMGYSARLAVNTGMRFRGNELNARRLGKTKAILEDARQPAQK